MSSTPGQQEQFGRNSTLRQITANEMELAMAENEVEEQSLEDKIARGVVISKRVLKRWPLALFVGILASGAVLAFFIVKKKGYYKSETLVLFQEPVQKDVIRGGEVRESYDLIQAMTRFLSSSTELRNVATKAGVYTNTGNLSEQELVEIIQGQIERKVTSASFKLGFRGQSPEQVQRMTKALADRFIEVSVEELSRNPQETAKFVQSQVTAAATEVASIEHELIQFKEKYQITVDATGQFVMKRNTAGKSVESRAIRDAAANDPELKDALAKKGQLEAQLAVLAGAPQAENENSKENELKSAKLALDRLLQSFTDQHPDVVAARQRVRVLQVAVDQERKSAGSNRRDTPEMLEIKSTIAALETKIQQRMAENARKNSAARSSQRGPEKPEKTPDPPKSADPKLLESTYTQIETRFAELSRSLQTAKSKLQSLEERANDSRTLSNAALETSKNAFRIQDPAYLPTKPIRPRKTKVLLMAIAAGLAAGLGAAVARVLLDPKIYDEEDLKQACRLPLLASIPKRTNARRS